MVGVSDRISMPDKGLLFQMNWKVFTQRGHVGMHKNIDNELAMSNLKQKKLAVSKGTAYTEL